MEHPRRIWRAIVVNRSMEPALREGDRLLVLPAGPHGLPWLRGVPRAGSVVIVERDGRFDVKRAAVPPEEIAAAARAGGEPILWLLGDNTAASNDSRHTGPIPLAALRGLVVWRIGPPGRRGRISRR